MQVIFKKYTWSYSESDGTKSDRESAMKYDCIRYIPALLFLVCVHAASAADTESAAVPTVGTITEFPSYAHNPASWMTDIPNIERATLKALTLPGTHDSMAFRFQNVIAPTGAGEKIVEGACEGLWDLSILSAKKAANVSRKKGRDFGLTQGVSILQQLRMGIRYFDIRVVYSVDGFYTHHGLLADPISDILSDIRFFLDNEAGQSEILLLSIQKTSEDELHYQLDIEDSINGYENVYIGSTVCKDLEEWGSIYRDMSSQHIQELDEIIASSLGDYIHVRKDGDPAIYDLRIGDIVDGRPKVILVEGGDTKSKFHKGKGTDKVLTSSCSDDPPGLDNCLQQPFIDTYYNGQGENLLELQWLLTAQEDQVRKSTECYLYEDLQDCDKWWCYVGPPLLWCAPICAVLKSKDLDCKSHEYDSTRELSRDAHAALDEFIYRENQGKVNIFRVDFPEESNVVKIALDHPVAICEDAIVSADEHCKGDADIDGGSADPAGEFIELQQTPAGPYDLGETLVDLRASDGKLHSNCSGTVEVVDDSAPEIVSLMATPDTLFPETHEMIPVSIAVSVDDHCDTTPNCRIVGVRSNERFPWPERRKARDAKWERNPANPENLTVYLRAKSSGRGHTAKNGRDYKIRVKCRDESGNASSRSVTVNVPNTDFRSKR